MVDDDGVAVAAAKVLGQQHMAAGGQDVYKRQPDMLPEVKVTFDGQELAPTAYKWHVPVVGSFFRRTYAETLNSSPVVLEDAISDASPDIIVTPSDYSTQLTITCLLYTSETHTECQLLLSQRCTQAHDVLRGWRMIAVEI